MRKLSAILLIGLFAFSQYARQLSWLECKFFNTFKSVANRCDCEKKVGFDKQDENQPPVSKIHTHAHFDEFFSTAKETLVDPHFKMIRSTSNRLASGDECEGNYPDPWRPPNS